MNVFTNVNFLKFISIAGLLALWFAMDYLNVKDAGLVTVIQGLLVGLGVNHISTSKGNTP